MHDVPRGVIKNREFATQIRDFRNLRFGNITPTDIDGAIEYHNKAYVYIETKYVGSEVPYGQRLFLERQCDDMSIVKPAISIITFHNTTGDIDVGNTVVSEYRYKRTWRNPKTQLTCKELVEKFLELVDKNEW
jgi:hypothetical protein